MALRLTRNNKIAFATLIVVLSVALGFLIWRVNQPDRLDPTDSDATTCPTGCYYHSVIQVCTGPGGCIDYKSGCAAGLKVETAPDGSKWCCDPCVSDGDDDDEPAPPPPAPNCGTEPTDYTYNKAPTSGIGPFPENGEVVLFYTSLLGSDYRPRLTFSHNGQTYVFKMPTLDGNKRARVETGIRVSAGDTITLVQSDDDNDQGSPTCEPGDPRYISFGWIAPSGGQCGSGLPGPPTGGVQTPMEKVSISSEVTWAQSFGKSIVGKGSHCWADWREWPGDYDFNDYFLQISYIAQAQVEEPDPEWSITKRAAEVCIDESTQNPKAELTYTITVRNTGDGSGTISKIEDVPDSKVDVSDIVSGSITTPGVYLSGKIVWDFTSTPLTFSPGQTRTYTYKLLLDSNEFGTYSNIVTLYHVGSSPVNANAQIVADCVITPEEEPEPPEEPQPPEEPTEETVPETGIFDTTVGRVTAGFLLVVLGAFVYNVPNGVFRVRGQEVSYKYRERFEKKVDNR